jgi:hypothetical protein
VRVQFISSSHARGVSLCVLLLTVVLRCVGHFDTLDTPLDTPLMPLPYARISRSWLQNDRATKTRRDDDRHRDAASAGCLGHFTHLYVGYSCRSLFAIPTIVSYSIIVVISYGLYKYFYRSAKI